jgi:hypothetical protein
VPAWKELDAVGEREAEESASEAVEDCGVGSVFFDFLEKRPKNLGILT